MAYNNRSVTPQKIRLIFQTIAGLLVIGAVTWLTISRTASLRQGPELLIHDPIPWSTVDDEIVIVSGTARNATHVHINGSEIFLDEEGNFEEELLVSAGYTIIHTSATDRFGNITQRDIPVQYAGTRIVPIVEKSTEPVVLTVVPSPASLQPNNNLDTSETLFNTPPEEEPTVSEEP